jgi:hypothetical protein
LYLGQFGARVLRVLASRVFRGGGYWGSSAVWVKRDLTVWLFGQSWRFGCWGRLGAGLWGEWQPGLGTAWHHGALGACVGADGGIGARGGNGDHAAPCFVGPSGVGMSPGFGAVWAFRAPWVLAVWGVYALALDVVGAVLYSGLVGSQRFGRIGAAFWVRHSFGRLVPTFAALFGITGLHRISAVVYCASSGPR